MTPSSGTASTAPAAPTEAEASPFPEALPVAPKFLRVAPYRECQVRGDFAPSRQLCTDQLPAAFSPFVRISDKGFDRFS